MKKFRNILAWVVMILCTASLLLSFKYELFSLKWGLTLLCLFMLVAVAITWVGEPLKMEIRELESENKKLKSLMKPSISELVNNLNFEHSMRYMSYPEGEKKDEYNKRMLKGIGFMEAIESIRQRYKL